MSSALNWWKLKVRRRIIHPILRSLYRRSNYGPERSILLAVAGRSGTTWLAEVIASHLRARILFEPFDRRYEDALRNIHYFHYQRPQDEHEELLAYSQRVFSGAVRHPRIDLVVETLFPRYRLIKAVRANLFLKWLHVRLPQVPILFLIRHPCAVVLSRMSSEWPTDMDLAPLVEQPKLMDDFLAERMDVIEGAKSQEAKHAIVWCVNNLVPLVQFGLGALKIVFYEHLCERPAQEFARVLGLLGQAPEAPGKALWRRPSVTSLPSSAVLTGQDRVERWTRELSSRQVAKIIPVVEAFGLDGLYGKSTRPLGTSEELDVPESAFYRKVEASLGPSVP